MTCVCLVIVLLLVDASLGLRQDNARDVTDRNQEQDWSQDLSYNLSETINFAWITDSNELQSFFADNGTSGSLLQVKRHKSLPVTFRTQSTRFGGGQFFANAMLKDLDDALTQELQNCNLILGGDRPGHVNTSATPRLWIIVNGEDNTGEEFVQRVQKLVPPSDHFIVLGNLWRAGDMRDIVRTDRYSSMWVPFASLHFAERQQHTPMDLLDRSRVPLQKRRNGTLAYMQSNCKPVREQMFGLVDDALVAAGKMPGSILGECNGTHGGGGFVNSPSANCELNCTGYDKSVGRYEDYEFVIAFEHVPNFHGYITEKVVNAFLAGSIPIGHSSFQTDEIFNAAAYVHIDTENETTMRLGVTEMKELFRDPADYSRVQQQASVVTDTSLKKFFSWHPAVWKTHGDALRRRIWQEMSYHCKALQSH